MQSVRRVGRDFGVAARCIERERSQSRVVIAMDDVMSKAGMLGMFCKKRFEDGAGFPLICVGLVTYGRIGADSEGVENCGFVILRIPLVNLAHCLFVSSARGVGRLSAFCNTIEAM